MRPRPVLLTAIVLVVVSVALGTPTLAGASRSGARHGLGGVPARVGSLGSPSATGASDLSNLGTGGWKVASSATATQQGAQISAPGFDTTSWLSVSNDDAGAPGTEIEALLQNGRCRNVFFSTNMRRCFGYERGVGADTVPRFKVPWWFRTDFHGYPRAGQHAVLIINGVIGQADVWVNGHRIAAASTVTGAYTRFAFPISRLLRAGRNSLAIEMHPNNPNRMFTLDDVDWNQIPPDNNTGIQFPVQLQVAGPLTDGNAHVIERNAANLSSSVLTIRADITNTSSRPQKGVFTATVRAPANLRAAITVRAPVTVAANATRVLSLSPARYPALQITHPAIWWPYQMGSQPLYTLSTSVSQQGRVLNSTAESFGIRTITSHLTGNSPEAPHGVRVFTINGRQFVVRGGGFSPSLFLHYSASNIAKQIALLKSLGLNTLRLEGHLMPDDFYRQMDRAGILINAGYQCCDAWQLPTNGHGVTAADYRILRLSALTLGQELRNHPSVFSFQWSDNQPTRKQEAVSLQAFRQADFTDPIISSAEYNSSPQLGPSGEKEGPYDWVPPDYWYDTTHYDPGDSTRTNVGGSWGYDSEQSAGNTVPTLDSIRRFMSAREQAKLWRDPGFNQYHTNYEGTGHSGYSFGTLYNFDKALSRRYGSWRSLGGYVEKAQLQNYENTRAQFEAFIDHSTHWPTPSTGTVYWQVNKGWPSLLWNLYNSDGDQAGSYFGAQEANESLHALYALDTGTVTVNNLGGSRQPGVSVESRVYDLAGRLLDDRRTGPLTVSSQGVVNDALHPKVPAATTEPEPARVYFVELLLRNSRGTIIDRNVYWLSTQRDTVNWHAIGNPQAKLSQYANLRALSSLPRAAVRARATTSWRSGPDGANLVTAVTITNVSATRTVAFFLRADVRQAPARGPKLHGGSELKSSMWDHNDISLWPGESETLDVTYHSADLRGATPMITVSGQNVPVFYLSAPLP